MSIQPSYGVLVSTIVASSLVFFTFFWLPYLVMAKVPSDAWTSRAGICPVPLMQVLDKLPYPTPAMLGVAFSQSNTQFTLSSSPLPFKKAELLTCHCYAMYLKCHIFHSPLPPIKDCGVVLLFSGDPCSASHYTISSCLLKGIMLTILSPL